MLRHLIPLLMLGAALCGAPALAATTVTAYNSYPGAPYVMGQRGLAPELVAYMNRKLHGKYQFRLHTLVRRDLNRIMEAPGGFDGVALFLTPELVGDLPQQRFHWSPAFVEDSNAVISRIDNPVRYDGPDSVLGLRFAGIYGNRYPGIDERIGKGVQRSNAPDALSNLRKLVAGEADFTVMPLSALRYLRRQMDAEKLPLGQLHVADKPHIRFGRHFALARGDSALAADLDRLAAAMPCDPDWRQIAVRYHFTTQEGCR